MVCSFNFVFVDEFYTDKGLEDESECESEEECGYDSNQEGSANLTNENDKEDEESADCNINASTLWSKSSAFHPILPECPHKNTMFDLWDLEAQSTPLDAFKHFIDNEIMEDIKMETNLYANQGNVNFKNWKDVSVEELWVFFALHLLMGVVKKPGYKDYFSTNPLLRTPIFGQNISRDRFFGILKALHIVDNHSEGAKSHRLNKLGKLLPYVCAKFKHTIQPGEFLCVDESLLLFKGRLAFLQYIPSKRARFGIKFYCLVDCESKFLIAILPYTGKTTKIDRSTIDQLRFGGATVATLVEDYVDGYRIVIFDNFFTSPLLLDYLGPKKTFVLETVRNNTKNMPVGIRGEKLGKGDVSVYCTEDKMVERWKDRRHVYMLNNFMPHAMVPAPNKRANAEDSSSVKPPKKSKTSETPKEAKLKPSSVLKYNSTMGGVDDVDRQIVHYVAERRSLKWYKKVVFHLFDLCVYNAFIIYKHQQNLNYMEYKKFLLELVSEILKEFKLARPRAGRKVHYEDPSALRLNGKHFPTRSLNSNGELCRQRCKLCFAKGVRHDTSYNCDTCRVPLCVTYRDKKSCFDSYHTMACLPTKQK